MSATTPQIITRKEEQTGWLIFSNPSRRNAVTLAMWEAIPKVLADFESDPDVRVIVLTGAGNKAFVAGADISEFDRVRNSAASIKYYAEQVSAANAAIATARKPTIAMIRGVCVGGGLGIALNCDLRISTADARFSIPAAKLGLGYGHTGLKQLVDLVGPSFAKEIFYTARLFSVSEALDMGLINRALPTAVLEDYVRDYCQTIAQNAPMTVQATKQIIGQVVAESPLDEAYCDQLVKNCFDSEDYIEGRRAFMEKRRPEFKGK